MSHMNPPSSPKKATDPWYNIFGGRYMGTEPAFYEREQLAWTKTFEDNWTIIRDEMTKLLADKPGRLKPYFINKSMSFPPRKWKTMGLYFWKYTMHRNCKRCPETVKILKSIPNLTSCSLSVLEPNANINPHQGDTDAIIRCHLGLLVPKGLPDCGFQVAGQIRRWEEGKILPFCDAHVHTAWNNSQHRRLVLIFDVMRPEFAHRQNEVCAHVLASSVMQMLYQQYAFLGRRPVWFKNLLYHAARIFIRLAIPIQRRWPF
ncbi:aspartyl/asparaginyl beta-hydroxylase domain-containing protein [Parapedobacter indicus]|uniref:Aspartyl/Asparaginyl beta-hydroxylase n=1 Tax=Parapedobacter indicus TaxID=1477437 RepID=A0A1I3HMK0_9SPHI|nr:aspartyl/asparaginyl beta-hydroxylase domain-containing protein [Parapedobacter indicus]PPL03099.1 aspartyl/asparaginyl beta-hydroxylase [Parapedobacter indicus]SFI36976.1 Aspartyl/Asparaginyl beta-hydroxylase [Parapedobacter indicus]